MASPLPGHVEPLTVAARGARPDRVQPRTRGVAA